VSTTARESGGKREKTNRRARHDNAQHETKKTTDQNEVKLLRRQGCFADPRGFVSQEKPLPTTMPLGKSKWWTGPFAA
jgi:hypothetical protein